MNYYDVKLIWNNNRKVDQIGPFHMDEDKEVETMCDIIEIIETCPYGNDYNYVDDNEGCTWIETFLNYETESTILHYLYD